MMIAILSDVVYFFGMLLIFLLAVTLWLDYIFAKIRQRKREKEAEKWWQEEFEKNREDESE